MAVDFFGKELRVDDLVQFDHTLKVATILGNKVVLVGKDLTLLVPANKCTLLTEEKLREEVSS